MYRSLPFLLACVVVGCRTAGPQIHMQGCAVYSVRMAGEVSARQGKSLPVEVLNDPTVSASQNGDADATRTALAAEEAE